MNWTVSEQKIRSYLLNIHHREGRSKARFFLARGFRDAEWGVFGQALRQHPIANAIAEEATTEYGRKFVVQCELQTPDGRNPCIRTVWMVETDASPRLITAYPAER